MLTIANTCIHCGRCAEDCPTQLIALQDGTPTQMHNACIQCGHCQAICPVHALQKSALPQDEILPIDQWPVVSAETARLFMQARRSIRQFQPQPVEKEQVTQLLNMARYAPTGGNAQGISYMVVGPEKMPGLRELLDNFFKNSSDENARALYQRQAQSGQDILLRGAPMLLLALTEKGDEYTRFNGRFAFTYAELYASALGLGTCWAGYFERYAFADSSDLRAYLDIPEKLGISAALMCGYPKYRYYTTVPRQPLTIHWR